MHYGSGAKSKGAEPVDGTPQVDSARRRPQVAGMKRKPLKVEEPAAPYIVEKPTTKRPASVSKTSGAGGLVISEAAARRLTEKVLVERKELLRKLAQ
jgi:hypothetical protein